MRGKEDLVGLRMVPTANTIGEVGSIGVSSRYGVAIAMFLLLCY